MMFNNGDVMASQGDAHCCVPSAPIHWMKALVEGKVVVSPCLRRLMFGEDGNLYEVGTDGIFCRMVRSLDLSDGYRAVDEGFDMVYEEAMKAVSEGGFVESETGTMIGFGQQGLLMLEDDSWVRIPDGFDEHDKLWCRLVIGRPPVMCGDSDIDNAARMLDGSNYPFTVSREEADRLAEKGLVVVYGASDDLMEYSGAFNDEFGAYRGTTANSSEGRTIEAVFAPKEDEGTTWVYRTGMARSEFRIMEGPEVYCYGIVFREILGETWMQEDEE